MEAALVTGTWNKGCAGTWRRCSGHCLSVGQKEQFIPSLVKGGFYHSGQVCVSVQRVFSFGSSARELAENIADHASGLIVGNAIDAETQCGPLIRNREVDRVEEWVAEAVDAGAEVVCGGKRLSASCYAPTVLLNPPETCRVSSQEIFWAYDFRL